MAMLIFLVIFSVFLRYVFNITYIWNEELITFLFLGTTYFGAALGIREKEHISIDILIEKLNPIMKKTISLLVSIIVIIVQVVVIKTSILWIEKVGNVLSPGLRIPLSLIYYLMPISCFLIIIYEVFNIINLLQYIKNKK